MFEFRYDNNTPTPYSAIVKKQITSVNTPSSISINRIENEKIDREVTEEEIKEIALFLENVLQDSIVVCSNDCCEETFDRNYVTDLAIKLVEILVNDSYIKPNEIEQILKTKIKSLTDTVDRLISRLRDYEEKYGYAYEDGSSEPYSKQTKQSFQDYNMKKKHKEHPKHDHDAW